MLIKIRLTNDMQLRKEIIEKLKANDGYCPCALVKTPDTVCMCKEFRDMEEGTCHCGLYVKEKIDKE